MAPTLGPRLSSEVPRPTPAARPHPELGGKLTLRISITGDGRKAEGTLTATMRNNDGSVLYQGEGPVVAATDHKGRLLERGVLAATIYDTNGPTDRRVIAKFA
jgi:hypothetical protein